MCDRWFLGGGGNTPRVGSEPFSVCSFDREADREDQARVSVDICR